MNIPDDRSLRIEGGLSISFWLYSQQDDISDWGWLLRKNTWPGNYYITDQGDGNTFFRVSDSDGNDYLVIASIIEYDTWIFLTYTYNPSTGWMWVWKNGEKRQSNYIGDVTPLYTDSTDLAISAGGRSCKGRIDEVRIYNRALSADEIKKIYTDEKAMFK